MQVQNNGWTYYPFPPGLFYTDSELARIINDDTDEVALPCPLAWAGTITEVVIPISTLTTSGVLNVRLETVGTDGNPSGTLVATNATGTFTPTTTGNFFVSINGGTGVAITPGPMFLRIKRAAAGTANLAVSAAQGLIAFGWPCLYDFNITGAGVWTRSGGIPKVAVKISGSYYVPLGCQLPFNTNASDNISSPAERGMIFTPAQGVRALGTFAFISLAAASTFQMSVYSDPLGTPAIITNGTTVVQDTDAVRVAGTLVYVVLPFASPPELLPGVVYGLVVQPLGVPVIGVRYAVPSNSTLLPSGGAIQTGLYLSRTSGTGAFTQPANSIPSMGLITDAIGPTDAEIAAQVWAYGNRTLT